MKTTWFGILTPNKDLGQGFVGNYLGSVFLHNQSFPAIQPLCIREANKSFGRGKFGHGEKQGSENLRVVVNHRQGDQGDTDALFSDDDIRFLVNREV